VSPKLLIFYDWFYPGYKAGGPIQSLANLVAAINSSFDIYIITSAFDLNAGKAYEGIISNEWNVIDLPGTEKPINVYYSTTENVSIPRLKKLISAVTPAAIYFNGLFSFRYFILPLIALKSLTQYYQIVVCPRGMLKTGALAGKSFKKKIYLSLMRMSGVLKIVRWHATSDEEAKDISFHFPRNKGIVVASNIPKTPVDNVNFITKEKGSLKFVSLSLINEHKNLLLLLQVIQSCPGDITLDIYGPVIDFNYWQQCLQLIEKMQGKVLYKGEIEPAKVQQMLSQYHALILLTKGENFGHSIYESLSVGRPVITSYFTPWNNLQEKMAGVNVDIANRDDCTKKITDLINMDQEDFNSYCAGSHNLSTDYYNNLDSTTGYVALFSV